MHHFCDMSERVGIRAVQSILKKATQSNLSMFHNAGNITQDSVFPRPSVIDILNVSKSASCSMNAIIEDVKIGLRKKLINIKISDILIRYSIIGESSVYDIWYDFCEKSYDSTLSRIRLHMNPRKMAEFGFTLNEICELSFKNDRYMCSPDFMGIVDIYVDTLNDIRNVTSRLDEEIIKFNHKDKNIISDAVIIDNRIYTIGSSLERLLTIDPKIKQTSVTSNSISDVELIFGIGATRNLIVELLDEDGAEIVADFMTRSGKCRPFDKSNIELYEKGFIQLVSFERSKDTIKKCLDNGYDPMSSIYSRIWKGF